MKVELGPYTDDDSKRLINIQIDPYDTWSMDSTLALIIVPMLKQLQATKHGMPIADIADFPPHIREQLRVVLGSDSNIDDAANYLHYTGSKSTCTEEQCDAIFAIFESGWEWIMEEMIFAMEKRIEDNSDSKYFDANNKLIDIDGLHQENIRIQNGFRLFGVYFQSLWD